MSTKAIREALEDLRLSLEDHPNTGAEDWARYVRARDEVDAIEASQSLGKAYGTPATGTDVASCTIPRDDQRDCPGSTQRTAHSAKFDPLVHIRRVFTFHDTKGDIAVTPSGVLRYQRSTGFWDDYHGSPLEQALASVLAAWAARAQTLYDEKRATKQRATGGCAETAGVVETVAPQTASKVGDAKPPVCVQHQCKNPPVLPSMFCCVHMENELRGSIKEIIGVFDGLLAEQGGKCAICETTDPGIKGWTFDRSHYTKHERTPRAVLCPDCNVMLDYAKDSTRVLEAAARHLLRRPV